MQKKVTFALIALLVVLVAPFTGVVKVAATSAPQQPIPANPAPVANNPGQLPASAPAGQAPAGQQPVYYAQPTTTTYDIYVYEYATNVFLDQSQVTLGQPNSIEQAIQGYFNSRPMALLNYHLVTYAERGMTQFGVGISVYVSKGYPAGSGYYSYLGSGYYPYSYYYPYSCYSYYYPIDYYYEPYIYTPVYTVDPVYSYVYPSYYYSYPSYVYPYYYYGGIVPVSSKYCVSTVELADGTEASEWKRCYGTSYYLY